MIKVIDVFSRKILGQKNKKKEKLFNQICDYFPNKFKFFKKVGLILHYYFQIIKRLKN